MCEIIFSRIFLGFPVLLLWMAGGPTHASFPLELNPPTVVVRYGDSVSVNCNTSSTDHEGMGWEATFGGTGLEQDVNVVTWTVDDLTDWTIEPKCYITLNDGKQSSKVLPVILYKTPDSVSISVLRHSGPMVEGTEYQLQCDIQNIAPQQNLVVKWYKGNELLDNVTYSNVSKTPVDVSPTLMISPSRDDDGAQYSCRAELDLGPEGQQPHPTVTSEPLNITVHYAPEFLPGNDTVEVSAGSDVSLDCSAEGNPPPELRWTNNTAEGNANETTVGHLRTLYISRVTANATYNCTVTNRLGSITKQIHVLVDVPPQQHPTMFSTAPSTPGTMTTLPATVKQKVNTFPLELNPPRVVVRYGDSVSVNCSTSSTDHEGMGWEATLGGTGLEQDVNVVTWTVDDLTDWTIEPKCYITLNDGKQSSKVLPVILYKTPDSVSISVLRHSGPMVEGTEYQLQCDIQNIAPQQNLVVKWYKGNELLDNVTYSNVSKTPVNVSATLMIIPSRDDDGAQYRCRAELDLGPEGQQPHPTVTSEPLNITVHYKPCINASRLPVRIPVFRGYPEELVCEAEGYPQPRIQWLYDPSKPVSQAGGNLTVFEAGFYNCTATNDVGTSFIVVEVVLNEDYLPLIAGFVAFMVVVISVIFVFIYSIYYKNNKMGRYSLKKAKLSSTPNSNVAQNGGRDTPFPMTKLSQPNIYF
ncbi:vascular cell adhesion protein 1-like [Salvelinus fontinalis]|uniref:vascular cell adhesion protein 1-like n=1 Tax=Salvelinus fontinalis TaxID=8038 RepID=UPI002486AB28|nr:vascular cell adhesion protein 1-like [Salvelinus fontinalis]